MGPVSLCFQPACTRTISNVSTQTFWEITITRANDRPEQWTIELHSGEHAQYYSSNRVRLDVVLKGGNKSHPQAARDENWFTYHPIFSTDGCYLDHDGHTGSAALNTPVSGDITLYDYAPSISTNSRLRHV